MPLTVADLDAACIAHLAHGAMAGADPLIDSLYGQLEAPAAEGAQQASTASAGLTERQRAALAELDREPAVNWWLVVAFLASAVYSWLSLQGA